MLRPSWLTWPLISAKSVEDRGSEVLGQLALADLITRGEFDRHVRRMRLRYAQRRRALLAALSGHVPAVKLHEDPAGLFEVLHVPTGLD